MARKPRIAITGAAIALLAATLVAPAASAKPCRGAAVAAAQLSAKQARGSALCLINQRRAERRLPGLRFSASLAAAAQSYSAEMDALDFFSHDSPTGSTPLSRITKAGYIAGASTWGIGENIAWGNGASGSPAAIVSMWMNSPGHRRIILTREFRHVGIGVVVGSPQGDSGDGVIYTADFGYRR
jgi:uncharacterized protein YkwD